MLHSFYIPVMGTSFTINTPIFVARYGISSVIPLADDVLIEEMRKVHCDQSKETYVAISDQDMDYRACRITAYLNLLDRLIKQQVKKLRASPFEPGSEITLYYELLPDSLSIKQSYDEMLLIDDPAKKKHLQNLLRKAIIPGNVDVNIMAKLDRDRFYDGKKLPSEFSDALTALRGYANSNLTSSIILSAGFNPRLYSYLANFDDFYPDANGNVKKQVVLKVSDYRSAIIQGKYLAKRGIWVSEYRVESSLNCGGHAFTSNGSLMGAILEEFKQKRNELAEKFYLIYNKALKNKGMPPTTNPRSIRITAQGGVGTSEEHNFLLNQYGVDAVGWGTPFLLVPEVTNVDNEHLEKLITATDKDVYLSNSSPLGIPFWNLRTSASEKNREKRILDSNPGSTCPRQYLLFNEKFTGTQLCRASRDYQKAELLKLKKEKLSREQFDAKVEDVLCKSCLCYDLAGSAEIKYGINPNTFPAICPGPNIVNFSYIVRLEEMLKHIYGKISLMTNNVRPHMFIKELKLNIDYLKNEVKRSLFGLLACSQQKMQETKDNLLSGIEYYQQLAKSFTEEQRDSFVKQLKNLREEIEKISLVPVTA